MKKGLTLKEQNLQERLAHAWRVQRIIRQARDERQQCRKSLKKVQEEQESRNTKILSIESEIAMLRKKEQEIDQGVIRAAALQKRTQEQMDMGKILDLDIGNAQIQKAQESIDLLEEEFFAVVEERENKEHHQK